MTKPDQQEQFERMRGENGELLTGEVLMRQIEDRSTKPGFNLEAELARLEEYIRLELIRLASLSGNDEMNATIDLILARSYAAGLRLGKKHASPPKNLPR